jgi:hypothetical protein
MGIFIKFHIGFSTKICHFSLGIPFIFERKCYFLLTKILLCHGSHNTEERKLLSIHNNVFSGNLKYLTELNANVNWSQFL